MTVSVPVGTRTLVALGAWLLVIGASATLATTTALYSDDGRLAAAITLDMAITAPLVYLAVVRRGGKPALLALPLFVTGVLLAGVILPADRQQTAQLLRTWGIAAVELVALGLIGWRAHRALRTWRSGRRQHPDARVALRQAAAAAVGPGLVADVLAWELAIIYYAVLAWRRPPADAGRVFSVHRTSGARAIVFALSGVIVVETAAVHLLLHRWPILAWISTLSGIYAVALLVAHARALVRRPVVVDHDGLHVRCGLAGDVDIPLGSIERVETLGSPNASEEGVYELGLLTMLETRNVCLRLSRSVRVERPYGLLAHPTRTLRLHVDRPDAFIRVVNERLADGRATS